MKKYVWEHYNNCWRYYGDGWAATVFENGAWIHVVGFLPIYIDGLVLLGDVERAFQ